jgi:hypothetical protein
MTFVIICLDGFGYEYLKKTKFLKKLLNKSIYGRAYHGPGYASELCAITGKNLNELGIVSNNFIYNPSGIKFYKCFNFLGNSRQIRVFLDLIYNAKEFFIGNNQPKSIFNLPLKYSGNFDFLMKKNFFSQKVMGHRTIFETLRTMNKTTVGYMWPFIYQNNKTQIDLLNIGKSTAYTDDRAFKKAICLLKKNPDIAYFHFFSTDNLVHKYGVDSNETLELIKKMDYFVEELSKYSDSLLVFSDHGMVNIRKSWNLWREVEASKLSYGEDYIMFLDSTLARFWFKNEHAKKIITNLLMKSKNGHILKFKNKNIVKYFGELIFKVNSGILILPNFYQSKPDKATHGYGDSCKEEDAFYIFYKNRINNLKKDTPINEIYNIILNNLQPES